MSKPRKLCIFCGGFPVTHEHIWADWLRPYIPRTAVNYQLRQGIIFKTHTESETKHRAGDPHSGRVRRVCESCNSGWMSRLQNRAKPILIPLLLNERASLRKPDQRTLAAWITMFTMVAEYKTRADELIAISDRERREFKNTEHPLENWKIWIGRMEDGRWGGKYVHNTLAVSSEEYAVKRTNSGVPVPNTQTTTFLVGRLYVHVLSSSSIYVSRHKINTRLLARIWPTKTSIVRWPPRQSLNDEEAEGLSMAIIRGVSKRTGAVDVP